MLGSIISPSSFLLSSFVQTWADKVVLFLFGSSLNVWRCEVILSLMEFFDKPIYWALLISALYITHLVWHLPSGMGQGSCLQLQSLMGSLVFVFLSSF